MEDGIRKGLNDLPARPMGVRGDELERISQCKGLYDEPGMLKPAPTKSAVWREVKFVSLS